MGNIISFAAFITALVLALGWYVVFVVTVVRPVSIPVGGTEDTRCLARVAAISGAAALIFVIWRVAFPLSVFGLLDALFPFHAPQAGPELYVMDREITDLSRVTLTPGAERTPRWSPDGSAVAYDSEYGAFRHRAMLLDMEDAWPEHLDRRIVAQAPCWSPDGREVLCDRARSMKVGRGRDLYAKTVTLSRGRWLTDTPAAEINPDWSPDGGRIVFERRDGSEVSIVILSLRDGEERVVARRGRLGAHPRWSPDGESIAYLSEDGVAEVPAEGEEPRALVQGRDIIAFDWPREGRLLVSEALDVPRTDLPWHRIGYLPFGSGRLVLCNLRTERRVELARLQRPSRGVTMSPDGERLAVTIPPGPPRWGRLLASLLVYAVIGPAAVWMALIARRRTGPSWPATLAMWTGVPVMIVFVATLMAFPLGTILLGP